jgi:hypothetical protein
VGMGRVVLVQTSQLRKFFAGVQVSPPKPSEPAEIENFRTMTGSMS